MQALKGDIDDLRGELAHVAEKKRPGMATSAVKMT